MEGRVKSFLRSIFQPYTLVEKVDTLEKQLAKVNKKQIAGNVTALSSWSISYDGEKNAGEVGPALSYSPDYDTLRARSWQAYLDNEVAQTVLNKYTKWVVGSGLKLQSEPNQQVLKSEKITIKTEDFNEVVEARFTVYAKSKTSDHSKMVNLHEKAKTAFINSIVGGDVLVILRFENNIVTTQLIDGEHVKSPNYSDSQILESEKRGNRIEHGVEISPSGEHIAFYVKEKDYSFKRIPAKSTETDLTVAFLVYGLKYRIDCIRGIPLISAVIESLSQMDRYKAATLGSAEERAKIVLSIEHEAFSTGESPLVHHMQRAFNVDAVAPDISGDSVAKNVSATTNKQAFNLPVGAKLKALESKSELHFKDFFTVNIDLICAALGIPPEVAMSKYDSNFSASRAALKDWEHTINVARAEFSYSFYQNIYNFWLETEILKNKVQAPGYLISKVEKNQVVLDAFRMSRWVGSNIPHVDPLKEVKAIREKLGAAGANIPLITVEQATEELGGGDSDQNLAQFAEELEEAKRLKVVQDSGEDKINVP
jgi:capsid protein